MKFTHASVFSGIGGPEIAATMLGWENVFHCEINPFGKAVLDYWYPNSKSYEDITKTDFSEWRGRVDVLTGGFPCQPFSYAGQRRGAEDDRYLWPHMFRCIDQVRPTWVVAENVAGILTMVEQGEVSPMESQGTLFDEGDGVRRHRLVETFTLQRICDDLEGHGYEVQPVLVPACAVGAPHRRDRVFIVGRRVEAFPQDTMHGGQLHRPNEEQGGERNERDTRARGGERLRGETSGIDTADSNGARQPSPDGENGRERETMDGECKGITLDGAFGLGTPSTSTDTARYAGNTNGAGSELPEESRVSAQCETEPRRICAGIRQGDRPVGERWQNFPSVSPVHRGNDGLPFDVDRLTLSFGKWRTEALKAYGNAIVPQVMYEIFRAIEIIEKTRQ